MRILVIGNGFDIEHNLKTKYTQFLDFCIWIRKIDGKNEDEINETNDSETFYPLYNMLKQESSDTIEELSGCIIGNLWIEYFARKRQELGSTWIDFESEIADIIKVFDKGRKEYLESTMFSSDYVLPSRATKAFVEEMFPLKNFGTLNGIAFGVYRKQMLDSLIKLIRALEIYIVYWVDASDVNIVNPDILKIHPSKIITFNYSHTFNRVYGKSDNNVEYCYIHGEAKRQSNIENCNMVLGIDDDPVKSNSIDVFCEEFKKYYQRLNKSTDTSYKRWMKQIKEDSNSVHELFIFGHSLDITDKEVLEPLISLENVNTTIFCLDKKKKSELLANLVKIIDKRTVINKIESGQIVFKIQSKSELILNSELEIRSDRNSLYGIKNNLFDDVDTLIDKIRNKVFAKDVKYFCNINYVIDVIDAINNNFFMDKELGNAFKELVITVIDQTGEEDLLVVENWYEPDFCNQATINRGTQLYVDFANNCIMKKRKIKSDIQCNYGIEFKYEHEKPDALTVDEFCALFEKIFLVCESQNYVNEVVIDDFINIITKNNMKNAQTGLTQFMNKTRELEYSKNWNHRMLFWNAVRKKLEEVDYCIYMEDTILEQDECSI